MVEKTEIQKKDGLSKTKELQKNDDSFAKAGADIVSNVVLAADSAGVADTLFSDDLVEAAKNYKKRAPINLTIESEEPKELVHTLSDLKDRALNLQRKDEQGILNESNGAGVVVRKDGQVNLAASKYSQYKLSPNGRATEQAMESVTITNRHKLFTEEIVVNEHKLNPQLWELADFRTSRLPTNDHAFVGGLCMFGSILVKAWEPNLKRYMLIRRPWLGPMFGPFLNVAEVNPALGISDPLKLEEDILALSDKGYQVNGIIKDAKSLIGKQGEDRSGIIRNQDAMASSGGTSSGGGSKGGSTGSINTSISISSSDLSDIWKALKQMGFNDIAAAGLMGCFMGESSGRFDALESDYLNMEEAQRVMKSKNRDEYNTWAIAYTSPNEGYDAQDGHGYFPGIGLAQWTAGRGLALFEMSNGEWWKPEVQIQFAANELGGAYANAFEEAQRQSTPEDAARVFAVEYEGGGFTGYADDRGVRAREIYEQFAGSGNSGKK